jgi:hypothetical protein
MEGEETYFEAVEFCCPKCNLVYLVDLCGYTKEQEERIRNGDYDCTCGTQCIKTS